MKILSKNKVAIPTMTKKTFIHKFLYRCIISRKI